LIAFYSARKFNADISGWDIRKVTTMVNMLEGASDFSQNYAWCNPIWQPFQSNFDASGAKSGRVICCNPGSYVSDIDPYGYTGAFPGGSGAGAWTLADSSACPKCPAGQYTDVLNLNASCKTCERNQIAPGDGLTDCSDCPNGKFSNDGINCETCPAGFETLVPTNVPSNSLAGTHNTTCEPCQDGKFSTTGNACNECPTGWYQEEDGKPFCLPCIRELNEQKFCNF
jgi:surface protein